MILDAFRVENEYKKQLKGKVFECSAPDHSQKGPKMAISVPASDALRNEVQRSQAKRSEAMQSAV